jgi:hypothetical protein
MQRRQQDGLPRHHASANPGLSALATLTPQDSRPVRTLRDALSAVAG